MSPPKCTHNMGNFGPLCWDLLASLGDPSKFQRVLRLGSITARHSSSGRQPKFAALKRGRDLHSAGRPSRWAVAHILVSSVMDSRLHTSFTTCHFHLFTVALWNRQTIIFLPCDFFLLLSFFFLSSPNLSGRRLDVYHTSTHGVALVRI